MVFLQLFKILILSKEIHNYDLVPEKYKLKNGRLVKEGTYVRPPFVLIHRLARATARKCLYGGGTSIPELRKNKNTIFEITITSMNIILIIYTQF